MEPITGIAAAMGKSVVASAVRITTTALVKEFYSNFVESKLKSHGAQAALLDGLKRHLKYVEQSTRYLPTIAIQGSQFSLEQVYEPLVLQRVPDEAKFEVTSFPDEVLAPGRNALITDAAGMGKSTLSKFIVRQCLCELKYIPVIIELRRIKPEQSIQSFICDQLVGCSASEPCKSKLLELFKFGIFVFMFDGYDEVSDSLRAQISADISCMADKFPECAFWLTSRPDAALASFVSFLQYSIMPLTQEKAHALLNRYDQGRGKATQLIAKIATIPQVNEFLGNPLLVTLLYKAYDYKATIPIKRNIFFRQVYDALYQDHDLSKEGAFERRKKSNLDSEDFHKALRALGVASFKTGRVQYSSEQFTGLLQQASTIVASLKIDTGKWRYDLLSGVPIFTKDGTDTRWSHKAFQDYFTAQFVYCDLGERRVEFVKRLFNDENLERYENLLLLLAEMDLMLLRQSFISDYLRNLRDTFVSPAAKYDDEVSFAVHCMVCDTEYVYVSTDTRKTNGGFFNFNRFPEFVDKIRRSLGRPVEFNRGSFHHISDSAGVIVITGKRWGVRRMVANLDPAAFSSYGPIRSGPTGEDHRFSERAKRASHRDMGLSWYSLNDAATRAESAAERLAIARLMFVASRDTLPPSLEGIKAVLDDEAEARRVERLDELLFDSWRDENI